MKIKLATILFLCSINPTVFAQNAQSPIMKIDGRVTPAQEKLMINAFLYLNQAWADKGKSLSQGITQKYFSPNTTLIINGKKIYTGYTQLDSHFQQVSQKIREKIRFPLLEVIGVDNKLIIHFNADITDNRGNYYPANVMAIFILHKGRIQRWEEVAHSSYFCQPESESVVYSSK